MGHREQRHVANDVHGVTLAATEVEL
jgi:hypothetical protein